MTTLTTTTSPNWTAIRKGIAVAASKLAGTTLSPVIAEANTRVRQAELRLQGAMMRLVPAIADITHGNVTPMAVTSQAVQELAAARSSFKQSLVAPTVVMGASAFICFGCFNLFSAVELHAHVQAALTITDHCQGVLPCTSASAHIRLSLSYDKDTLESDVPRGDALLAVLESLATNVSLERSVVQAAIMQYTDALVYAQVTTGSLATDLNAIMGGSGTSAVIRPLVRPGDALTAAACSCTRCGSCMTQQQAQLHVAHAAFVATAYRE